MRVAVVALADVRRQHDVRERAQRRGHARLVLEDVEAGGGDAAARERADQRRLVDDRSAARVHQDRRRASCGRARGAPIRWRVAGVERHVDRHEVGRRRAGAASGA